MTQKVSVAGVARSAVAADKRARKAAKLPVLDAKLTKDSFVNFAQRMGVGADNALTSAGYGFNPITRIRTMLEWIYRGSWIGGVAVDLVAEDMSRAGVELLGEVSPKNTQQIEEAVTSLGVWNSVSNVTKWSRLYGGAIGVMMVKGQDYATPLRLETIDKGMFKGVLVFDRWMVEPSLNDLVNEEGPDMGNPKFYTVFGDAPSLRGRKVHHSRCLRMVGIEMPYNQKIQENLWGISVLERLYDRMIAFDSATTGAAQLVYKAYIRTYKIKNLRQIIAAGGDALSGLVGYTEMMRRFQGQEGITLLDAEDEFEAMQHAAFAGLSDALLQFGQQLSGALQIPLVRLFGQSPAGLNSTGESDLRMYYDGILSQQNRVLKVPMTRIYRAVAQSEGIRLPSGFGIRFKNLWQLQEKEKAEIAEIISRTITAAEDGGIISQKTAMTELKQSSGVTGIFTNIEQSEINAAEETLPPAGAEAADLEQEAAMVPPAAGAAGKPGAKKPADPKAAAKKPAPSSKAKTKDFIGSIVGMLKNHDLHVVLEHLKGQLRRGVSAEGKGWEAILGADYGYVMRTVGADGENVDCFIGPNPASAQVWVLSQCDAVTKEFDEHKCLLGYDTLESALIDYATSYSDGLALERVSAVHFMTMAQFKEWLARKHSLT